MDDSASGWNSTAEIDAEYYQSRLDVSNVIDTDGATQNDDGDA